MFLKHIIYLPRRNYLMHFTRLYATIWGILLTCYSIVKGENNCGSLKTLLQSSVVSLKIKNNGFHREVESTVELQPGAFRDVQVLLVYNWPKGVYVDPYQLAFLSDAVDWQILVDSAINLELPAHKASSFVTYVYPSFREENPGKLQVSIPVHGRYHQPTFVGETWESIVIEPPKLLLRSENCWQLGDLEPYTTTEAPCSADNASGCLWVQAQDWQSPGSQTFHLPVGDGSLVAPVCGVTLAVTMICCLLLSKYTWKHRIV